MILNHFFWECRMLYMGGIVFKIIIQTNHILLININQMEL